MERPHVSGESILTEGVVLPITLGRHQRTELVVLVQLR